MPLLVTDTLRKLPHNSTNGLWSCLTQPPFQYWRRNQCLPPFQFLTLLHLLIWKLSNWGFALFTRNRLRQPAYFQRGQWMVTTFVHNKQSYAEHFSYMLLFLYQASSASCPATSYQPSKPLSVYHVLLPVSNQTANCTAQLLVLLNVNQILK